MNESPVLLPIDSLTPHPKNPRVMKREDVISAIEQQIRTGGFDVSHAVTARPWNGKYQIISGHNRVDAATRAGVKQVPVWIREMDDETAFMHLVLSNTQGELSPLERGMHALAATEKGRHGRSIAAYATQTRRAESTVKHEVHAAEVAKVVPQGTISELLNRTKHLAEIHAAPEQCWPVLAERLIKESWTVERTAQHVAEIRNLKPPRGYEKLFGVSYLQQMAASGENVLEITNNLIRTIERVKSDIRSGQFDTEEYQEAFGNWLSEHGPWDGAAIAAQGQRLIEAQRKARQEADKKAAQLKRAVTLPEWKSLKHAECQALTSVRNDKAKLNRQDDDSIEWARWSWNPVTGCNHNCPYCYARDFAERIYPQKFEPSIVPDALAAPLNSAPPKEATNDLGWKNIFTCSMADLFGNWVPAEWIEAVLSVVRESKQWNFLFLTKFPQRLREFQFPENAWLGTSVDLQARVTIAERAMRDVKATVKWISIEPMIEPIVIDYSLFQWIVIGGASKSSQTPEWKPPRKWVIDVTARAMATGCAVYHKTNLNLDRLRDYPGTDNKESEQAPTPFHYLKTLKAAIS